MFYNSQKLRAFQLLFIERRNSAILAIEFETSPTRKTIQLQLRSQVCVDMAFTHRRCTFLCRVSRYRTSVRTNLRASRFVAGLLSTWNLGLYLDR
ncbi:hypothetical protein MTO96_044612 [Rhipicephalus appendiculatus]